jgi:hypothetical protein
MGSEVVQFIEAQKLGRVFLELGVRGGGVNFTDYEKYKRSRSGDVKLKTNEPLTSPFNACA